MDMCERLVHATSLYQKTAFNGFDNISSSFERVKYTTNFSSTHPNSVFLISACCRVCYTKRLLWFLVIMPTGHWVTHNTHNRAVNLLHETIMGGSTGWDCVLIIEPIGLKVTNGCGCIIHASEGCGPKSIVNPKLDMTLNFLHLYNQLQISHTNTMKTAYKHYKNDTMGTKYTLTIPRPIY